MAHSTSGEVTWFSTKTGGIETLMGHYNVNMKKALCLSGFMNCFRMGFKHMREQFDGDVFLSVWDTESYQSSKKVDPDELRECYNLKGFEVLPYEATNEFLQAKCEYMKKYRDYQAKWHKNREGWHSMSLFHLIRRVGILKREHEIKNGFRYDTVIRFRPDYVYRGLFEFEKQPDFLYFPANANCAGVTDGLVCGDSKTMDKFFLLPDLMDIYLLKEDAVWVNEHMVLHHVRSQGLKVARVESWTYRSADGTPPGGDQLPVGW
jgi:hypothetical protein